MRGKWKETIDSLDIGDFLEPFTAAELLRHPAYEFNQEENLKLKLDLSTLLKTSPYYSRIEIFPYDPLLDGDDPDNIRYEEVFFSDDEDGMGSQDTCEPGNIKKYVRGSLNSVPFQPGGENWVKPEASKARTRILEEAMSLKWLREWESGNLPDIEVPGYAEYVASMDFSDQGPAMEEAMGAQDESAAGKQDEEAVINISNILDGILPLGESDSEAEEEEKKQEESSAQEIGSVDRAQPGQEGGEPVTDEAPEEEDASSILEKVLQGDLSVEKALVGTHSKHRAEEVWAVREPIPDLETKWRELTPKLARKYPFELDTFQKEAIWHMENDDCVFVAAHTSAGKTVAAEYAFALSESHCTRAVYTSPIKTISNQKFRDFSGQFEVGILTGDVSIRPESSCLIMTTEILRSMLYKGADIIRDIEWVIFDEVHYVNDAERGVVWEEVIIMLPDHIKLLMLSATVPNVLEFANWVGKTKQKKVYVCGTNKRPVPLEHALYYGGKFFTICTHEKYDPTGWKKAKEEHAKKSGTPKTKAEAKAALPTGRGGPPKQGKTVQPVAPQYKTAEMKLKSERSQWGSLIEKFKKQSLLPMVGFCFSKRRCDALADSLRSLDLTSGSEKSEIHLFCDKAFSRLHSSDRNLPQLKRIKEMLKRGLGIHHAGLLPIVKEVVEMLFCRGVIKVLFATETFAMGVNAPARAVVFQSIRKHDGRSFRNLLPGEYTQMAGRAGRRGLDTVGTVVIACWEEPPSEIEIKKMLTGAATKLESQFRLTYNMILNLLRVEDLKVEDMLKRSFAEFHAQRCAPDEQKAIVAGQNALVKLQEKPWPVSSMASTKEEVEHYVDISLRAERLGSQIQEDVMLSRGAMNALTNGRVILIEKRGTGLADLGVILKPSGAEGKGKKKSKMVQLKSNDDSSTTRTILRLLTDSPLDHLSETEQNIETKSKEKNSDSFVGMKAIGGKSDDLDDMFAGMRVAGKQGPSENLIKLPHQGDIGGTRYEINELDVREIVAISSLKIDVDSEKVLQGNKGKIAITVQELHRLSGESLSLLDPISDMKVNRIDIVSTIRERQMILNEMMSMQVHRDPLLPEMVALVRSEAILTSRLKQLMRKTGEAGLSQLPEFHQRIKVLQKMGYVRSDKTISLKGRVACEINSGSELVGTEMIFGGLLTELTPEEAVALLSGLVFQDKTDVDTFDVPDTLMDAYERALAIAWNAGEEQAAVGLNILPDEFVKETLNFGLMSVVYHWARGKPFAEICEMTDVMEGSIVRCIVRLDETCREFRDAARVMGDMKFSQQMDEASEAIKRDIVFAASLYIV